MEPEAVRHPKLVRRWTTTAAALCLLGPTALLAQNRANRAAAGVDYVAMSEDIEVMQRILNKALAQHHGTGQWQQQRNALDAFFADPDTAKDNTQTAYLYAQAAQNLGSTGQQSYGFEGFYVPGTGVIYTLNLPVQFNEVESEETDESADDLWKQTQSEMKQGPQQAWRSALLNQKPKVVAVDEAARDAAIEVLIKTIAEFGTRMEQLSSDESIVLIARVTLKGEVGGLFAVRSLNTLYTARGSTAERAVVRVPMSLIRDFSAGRIESGELINRADITVYQRFAGHGRAPWFGPSER